MNRIVKLEVDLWKMGSDYFVAIKFLNTFVYLNNRLIQSLPNVTYTLGNVLLFVTSVIYCLLQLVIKNMINSHFNSRIINYQD